MRPKLAAPAQLLDVGRHTLADAGNLQQLLGLVDQPRDLLRQSFERLGGAAIGADAEGVVAVDLHQIGGFVEDVGDGLVVHARVPERNCNVERSYALRFRRLSEPEIFHILMQRHAEEIRNLAGGDVAMFFIEAHGAL